MPATESCTARLPPTKNCSVTLYRLSAIKKSCSVSLSKLFLTGKWCSVRLCRLSVTKNCSVKISRLQVTRKHCSVRSSRLLMATVAQKLGKQGSTSGSMGVPQGEECDEQTDPHEKPRDMDGETIGGRPEQGQEPLPQELSLTPCSAGNRQPRKRVPNPKYQTQTDTNNVDSQSPDSMEKPKKKRGPRKSAVPSTETDPSNLTVQKTPKQKTPRKTPAKKTPQKKSPEKKAVVLTMDGEQEPIKQKPIKQPPPKKTPAKKSQQETAQVNSTPSPAVLDLMETPGNVETTPGSRPKRRAAKVALQYLHNLAKEIYDQPDNAMNNDRTSSAVSSPCSTLPQKQTRAKKRKASGFDTDNETDDKDFLPDKPNEDDDDDDEEESEYEEDQQDIDLDNKMWLKSATQKDHKTRCLSRALTNQPRFYGNASNGLANTIMRPVWDCTETTKKFRDEYCNEWVFADWMPSEKDWRCLSNSEVERYLPQEMISPAFTCSREGIKENSPLHRMKRFESLPHNPKRWDIMFYTGGPVWAMDWCPTPDGARANQYAAIYSHKDLDHQHKINRLYTEPGLIQIWDLGQLQYNTSPPSSPLLAYGIAQDKGFVWNMKWCPGGCWELPTTSRKAPHMPRLGLLATSSSDGHISIYSLPHPESLLARRKPTATGETSPETTIYQVQAVITLKRGSFKTDHDEKASQVLSLDWLPVKPHNILVAGFYDGTVALWDLSSRSALQRVRAPDRSFTLYPYHCFMAHDNAVRALSFCHASRDLIVSAGDDRMVKMWDLRRTWEPCQSFKRFLSTEAAWPLHWPGVFVSQESTYGTFGIHGLNYFDSGYLGFKPLLLAPRKGTMWSLSISDWLNTAVTSDSLGEVIMVVLPNLFNNPCYLKRSVSRRLPIFRTEMVLLEEEIEDEEGEGSEEGSGSATNGSAHTLTYKATAKKYYLHYHDMDMTTFKNVQNRAPWKHMHASEVKGRVDLDLMPLASINKTRTNPNLCAQSWVLSGGQSGLVRAHCLRAMNSSNINKMVQDSQAQFSTMFMQETTDGQEDASVVRHTTQKL
ncbi:hypothetical protein DPEC_G00085560 [Dallia pectoralis]|uniref:Uncharacterized protein n=1 Tax=Dallia pectoralis TaxID=75939 RepID=A0ACC2H009_DALPE|nr:hypothetical protein DPEC_G00085560 [Dallia pectoralis]